VGNGQDTALEQRDERKESALRQRGAGISRSRAKCLRRASSPGVASLPAQSGHELFALGRTPQTVTVVPSDFLGGNGQFYARVVDLQEADATRSYQQALWLADLDFAGAFGCALYRGPLFQPLHGVFRP